MGGSSSPKNTTSTTTNNLDPNVARWTQNNYNAAQNVANQPYNPYTGQMIAPLNGMQMQGINQGAADAANGIGMGAVNQGINAATQAGQYQPQQVGTGQWGAGAAQQYMSPYTQQVIDASNAQIDKNLAQTTNATNAQATAAGAFGGTRQAVQTAQNQNDANQLKASTAAGLQQDAYNNAQQAFMADQQRQLQAGMSNQQAGLNAANLGLGSADLLGRLGAQQQQTSQGNANTLLGLGGTLQGQQQQQNEWDYQNNYLNPQQWPLRGLNALESAVSGIPYGSSSSSTTPMYQNKTAGALGGAASGAAMGSMFGPWGTAIGGGVGGLLGLFG